jgi:hypothetical protein
VELELFSSLIETLYDAALNPSEWPRVARLFAQALGSESCAIWHLNRAQGAAGILGLTENFDTKAISDYEAYYHQKDLVAIRMAQSGTGQAMLSTDVVREAEFLDSEIFIDYAKPMRLGFFWSVGGVIPAAHVPSRRPTNTTSTCCYLTCRGRWFCNADSKALLRTTGWSSTPWRNSRSA